MCQISWGKISYFYLGYFTALDTLKIYLPIIYRL